MFTNGNLNHAIADALIQAYGQDATEWLECGTARWRAAISGAAWVYRPEDGHGLRSGTKACVGEVFAHELVLGDTGEPFESIGYTRREHCEAVRGEDDEQPWNAAPALYCAETRSEACLAEARVGERRVPFLDRPGRLRQAKAIAAAGEARGWTPLDDGPVFRYVRRIREAGEERMVPPDLRLRTVHLVELVCPPDRSVVLTEEGLR